MDHSDAKTQQATDATQAFLDSLPELGPGESFRFACHPSVPCFNACCGDLNLMLTPYDTLRLRRSLRLGAGEFARLYANLTLTPDTGFPMLALEMLPNKPRKPCPFVSEKGCLVYENRPGACRTYPLGRATRLDDNGQVVEQYFVVREPHCRGFQESTSWDAPSWLKDQGLTDYYHFNDRYMRLMALARTHGIRLAQKQANMVFLAQYTPDAFQDFIVRMNLFEHLLMDPSLPERILADEVACLEFGLDWLELLFFGSSPTLARKT
ncbi:YkgJ family cysteine cluster protein [Desulfolutivibrio sulfoxidireducens]|uniref:YkgJ family cysteine cluster protein n=1 Tax=Desulfolutivibrio sulfoxidireducens TaxID=2773299 RepID=UPI00159E5C0D|nr:YkgJ family cysteine cluster protein [Desulfolutivibrio sulfoxidireducens]QLA16359.1 YkgJ family cysteine cluster protein [Desulfolutivibrio sulfoxidireducens]